MARRIHPLGGNAYTVGITGAPGAGKSTLTDGLIREVRSQGAEVGVLAIDPSSAFTGGAFLADRVPGITEVRAKGIDFDVLEEAY